jgi:catechol 2,3-dioxygenase-like lactoylglutathione lyase family enzyme
MPATTTLKRPAPAAKPMPKIQGLNHWAYRCRDAEETRHFYEDILGLPLACVIKADNVPSTGEYCPYVHIFFEMADGSFVAFFDLGDDTATVPDPATPAWVNHLALQMASVEDVKAAKKRLEDNGVEVLGVTDHGFLQSIYFFDPNGVRLELTAYTTTPEEMQKKKAQARASLKAWTDRPR